MVMIGGSTQKEWKDIMMDGSILGGIGVGAAVVGMDQVVYDLIRQTPLATMGPVIRYGGIFTTVFLASIGLDIYYKYIHNYGK